MAGVAAGADAQTLGLLGVPPPHVCPPGHVPQLMVPPQPLEIVPQLSPTGQAVSGVALTRIPE
jgi:hypothetical protein